AKSLLINDAMVWDIAGRPSKMFPDDGCLVGFADIQEVVVGFSARQGITFWRRENGLTLVHQFGAYGRQNESAGASRILNGRTFVASLAPSGRTIAIEPLSCGAHDHTLELRSYPSGRLAGRLQGHEGRINTVSFSADGKYAITGSED